MVILTATERRRGDTGGEWDGDDSDDPWMDIVSRRKEGTEEARDRLDGRPSSVPGDITMYSCKERVLG